MTDTTASDRSSPKSPRPSQSSMIAQQPYLIGGGVIVVLIVAVYFAYNLGWSRGTTMFNQLQTEEANETIKYNDKVSELQKQKKDNASLTKELNETKDKLNEVFQSTRQIKLTATQAMRVSVGSFTVGLGTGLGSDSVNVNINGQQQTIAPGNTQNLTFSCVIELQSFDLLSPSATGDVLSPSATGDGRSPSATGDGRSPSATFNTSCSPVKAPDATAQSPNPATK